MVAGTTDGCASFLATGATEAGDGVTALGSSLTIKLLSGKPLFAPEYGIYSHRIGDAWLAGGASNTGGKVLAQHFPVERIVELSQSIDPETSTGLDYYPLPGKGERFPVADPANAATPVAAPARRCGVPEGDIRRHRRRSRRWPTGASANWAARR